MDATFHFFFPECSEKVKNVIKENVSFVRHVGLLLRPLTADGDHPVCSELKIYRERRGGSWIAIPVQCCGPESGH